MNGHASRGNVLQCWSLLVDILKNKECEADILCFSVMLKSLSRMNNDAKFKKKRKHFLEVSMDESVHGLGVDDLWKMIKFVLMKMKELNRKIRK